MTMGAIQNHENEESSLDALLGDLNLMGEEAAPLVTEEIIEESAPVLETTSVADVAEEVEVVVEAPKKAKGGKKAGEKKVKEPKAPKELKPKVERKFYANKVERITDKLGDKIGEYTVLELNDALLEGDALAAKQQETLDAIKTSGKKVQNRITFILEFIAGKSTKLNGVITTALKVLKKDGKINVGVEGNLYQALVAHPYSPNAAKAMGGNTLLALKALKVIVPGDKGEYVANDQSLVLAKLNAMGV